MRVRECADKALPHSGILARETWFLFGLGDKGNVLAHNVLCLGIGTCCGGWVSFLFVRFRVAKGQAWQCFIGILSSPWPGGT